MTAPVFEARATLQIDIDLNILGVDRPLVPLDQRDWMREFLPTQLGILQSRDLVRRAHDELTRTAFLERGSAEGAHDFRNARRRRETSAYGG